MKIKLFTYWEGKKSDYINLCEKIIQKNICKDIDLHLVTDVNLHEYIAVNELPQNFKNIKCLAHRADYIRCCLVYKYGGIWLDSDQILVSDLSEVIELLKTYDYITYEWEKYQPSISFFAANKNNILLERWKSEMEMLISQKIEFNWTELGYDLLYPLLDQLINLNLLKYYAFYATTSFAPLEWHQYENFLKTDENLNTENIKSIHLFNAKLPEWFKNMNEKEILSGDYLVSKLFRKNL